VCCVALTHASVYVARACVCAGLLPRCASSSAPLCFPPSVESPGSWRRCALVFSSNSPLSSIGGWLGACLRPLPRVTASLVDCVAMMAQLAAAVAVTSGACRRSIERGLCDTTTGNTHKTTHVQGSHSLNKAANCCTRPLSSRPPLLLLDLACSAGPCANWQRQP
jgi:hypothetical protein